MELESEVNQLRRVVDDQTAEIHSLKFKLETLETQVVRTELWERSQKYE